MLCQNVIIFGGPIVILKQASRGARRCGLVHAFEGEGGGGEERGEGKGGLSDMK